MIINQHDQLSIIRTKKLSSFGAPMAYLHDKTNHCVHQFKSI